MSRVTIEELRRAVSHLKASSSWGPDGIPPYLVKDCIGTIELPFLHIFGLSLQRGQYPSRWKLSRVTPVPKSGASQDVTNFRPIAVLSAFGKVFETVLNSYISGRINKLLHDSQHGFRAARSATTNHVRFVDYVTSQMSSIHQVDAAYFDYRKAFDLVDNDILLTKLSVFGFAPGFLSLFASYLQDRQQYVQMNSCRSEFYYTRSGLSQGSTLGPTLFLIIINDLPKVLKTAHCLMFADDLKLFSAVDDVSCCQALQKDIDAVVEWNHCNKLCFNITKCCTMTFSRSRYPLFFSYFVQGSMLQRVDKARDLGLIVDAKLDFHDHIITMCKSANKILGFIMRTAANFHAITTAILLYHAYMRSKLEYSAIVWDPCEHKYALLVERIQRKFARYIYVRGYGYYPFLYPSLFVCGMVGMDTLELRRKQTLGLHYCMLLRNLVDNPTVLQNISLFVPENYIRTGRRYRQLLVTNAPITTRYANHAPTPRAVNLLNDLLHNVQDIDIFTSAIYKLMLSLNMYLSK